MNGIRLMVRKEWRCLLGAERSMFVLYGVIVLLWSLLFVGTAVNENPFALALWLLPFSIIVVTNFAQTVFVAERVNGAIEILLTCGLSRSAVVLGKLAFVVAASLGMGLLCVGLSWIWTWLFRGLGNEWPGMALLLQYAALFVSAVLLNSSLAALLSLWLPNPRMSHFVNFLVMALVLAVYYPLMPRLPAPVLLLTTAFTVGAGLAIAATLRLAQGERMVRPVSV